MVRCLVLFGRNLARFMDRSRQMGKLAERKVRSMFTNTFINLIFFLLQLKIHGMHYYNSRPPLVDMDPHPADSAAVGFYTRQPLTCFPACGSLGLPIFRNNLIVRGSGKVEFAFNSLRL